MVVLSLSLSSLAPNTELAGDPPNKLVVVEDPPKRDPEDVELEVKPPNKVVLEPSFDDPSGVFFAREEAKKFGIVEDDDLLSGLVVALKPNVGAGGPPEDSVVGAGVGGNANPVDDFELSMDVGGKKPVGFEPTEGGPSPSEGFGPDVLEGTGGDDFEAGGMEDAGVLDKFGALKRIDGPGSGPRGRVFLGELLKEPASCLSHTD